ncbi:acetyl-CoA carboxylase biotin carboxyl carrier protein [Pediococcus claussenii]|uniref:Acetyl-CoA carboxylase, biotin carboxyl carrier protein n=1 Tax=Pediococcus claussenii (strain ATCC BAA-344 / DSM 14800 / JCM 18046 / KCTC 3811 / LMG 21948 / P06) TaxID=701521 RepID=G8PB45_PEDCP|nr:biotin/lipoyl-containing protein [Pediococcus claussenii]AEV94674.1 acetyl-CoA carboxylase, biotin carboxyl carrier protein [Pediococcus claussenii ATCC BAA-344]ANZ69870.1 hypothetical protein AYR57_05910 [Pediococcus claussenii]ANZ71687.1 hypothetical protein AYR58_05915 [Pediococcus claussenii]KRN20853.1 accB protein [Pediococcus claussenii]
MDIEDVFKVIDRLKEYPYDDIDIETKELKLHLKKHSTNERRQPKLKETEVNTTVNSPMVGIIHLNDEIRVGTQVEEGIPIAQIESMKLFNDIKAPIKGKIIEILVSNDEGVEFEQPILTISGD